MMQDARIYGLDARKTQMHKCICVLCTKILTPTQITLQNPIQIKEFKNESSKIRIYMEFASNDNIQFQEKLKVNNSLK